MLPEPTAQESWTSIALLNPSLKQSEVATTMIPGRVASQGCAWIDWRSEFSICPHSGWVGDGKPKEAQAEKADIATLRDRLREAAFLVTPNVSGAISTPTTEAEVDAFTGAVVAIVADIEKQGTAA